MTWHFDYHPSASESSVPVVGRWLWPGNRTFLQVASMVVTWWIVGFLCSEYMYNNYPPSTKARYLVFPWACHAKISVFQTKLLLFMASPLLVLLFQIDTIPVKQNSSGIMGEFQTSLCKSSIYGCRIGSCKKMIISSVTFFLPISTV